jgi:MFS family permease
MSLGSHPLSVLQPWRLFPIVSAFLTRKIGWFPAPGMPRGPRRLQTSVQHATLTPLREPTFRRIWFSSLFCNAAQQIQAVAAAWTMVKLTAAAERVALVQTASMIPLMLLASPGRAVADIYDHRKAALMALLLAFTGALALWLLCSGGLVSPVNLLVGCLVTGAGIAFFTPAWGASVIELVGAQALPAGVALNSMSNNIARSVGPALDGAALVSWGVSATLGSPSCCMCRCLSHCQCGTGPRLAKRCRRRSSGELPLRA